MRFQPRRLTPFITGLLVSMTLLRESPVSARVTVLSQTDESMTLEWQPAEPEPGTGNSDSILHETDQAILIALPPEATTRVQILTPHRPDAVQATHQMPHRGRRLVRLEHNLPAVDASPIRLRLSWQPRTRSQAATVPIATANSRQAWQRRMATPETLPELRIPVIEPGIVTANRQQLSEALGLAIEEIDLDQIHLRHGETAIPYGQQIVSPDTPSPLDSIYFYAFGTNTLYTSTNVFWLRHGATTGLKLPEVFSTPDGAAPIPQAFPETIHAEEDLHIWQTMPRGGMQDRWFWGDRLNAPGTRDYPITVPTPLPQQHQATLRAAYHGLTFATQANRDHLSQLFLNGIYVGDLYWDDRNAALQVEGIPSTFLLTGENEVTVSAPGIPGIVVDQFFINWFEIDYLRQYVAQNNRLTFRAPRAGQFTFQVRGFSEVPLDVLDITSPSEPKRLTDFAIVPEGNTQRLELTATANSDSEWLAQSTSHRRPLSRIEPDTPSFWREFEPGADHIIITHEEFLAAAQRLADHRASQGLRTAVVLVQDIYDEFGSGIFDPQAIRDFIHFAYHQWTPPRPQYVVLMGDAYLDYRDNLKTGSINYIPSQQITSELIGLTVSDNWYAQVDGDDKIPDLLLGRIAVRIANEANRVVERIIRYETDPVPGEWMNQVALIADDEDQEFADLSDDLAEQISPEFTVTKYYAAEQPNASAGDIINLFQSGQSLITYTGHGTIASWGLTGGGAILLSGPNASSINPKGQWPIVTVANCLNGFFAARHSSPCLAEILQSSPNGGAIAVWAPTSLGFPEGHRILMREFYRMLFEKGVTTLGEATTAAQIATFVENPVWLELLETYVLFGDPALRIRFAPRNPQPQRVERLTTPQTIDIPFDPTTPHPTRLETTTSLTAPASWQPVDCPPHAPGLYRVEINPQQPARFFRVVITPAPSQAAPF